MEYNSEPFRLLIEREMKGKTRKEFAVFCGIAPETLYRYLAENNPKRPSKTVLRKIADKTGLSYKELCDACGYEDFLSKYEMDADTRAVQNIENIKDSMEKMTSGVHAYSDLSHFLDEYQMLYSQEDIEYSYSTKKEYEGEWVRDAEYYSTVCVRFKTKEGECKTWFVLYYYVTTGGKIIVTGCDTSGRALVEAGAIEPASYDSLIEEGKDPAMLPYLYQIRHMDLGSRLLESIFGYDSIEYLSTVTGFGFVLNEVPPNFLSFMENHQNSFCIGEKEKAVFEKLTQGEDPEKLFQKYEDPVTCFSGIGAAVAVTMRNETELEFEWLKGENGSDSCVLLPRENDDYSIRELRRVVYPYAKELGLRQFGECYVTIKDFLDPNAIFTI